MTVADQAPHPTQGPHSTEELQPNTGARGHEPSPPAGLPDITLPEGSRIVHIGPHKTGTSSLQAAFFARRAEAAEQGVYYASEGKHAMTAVLAALDLPSPWSNERKPPPRWKWTRLLALIRATSAKRVLLSSEFFTDGTPPAIARVMDELDRDRVQVVVTLRPLSRILPSQWQQWVQNRFTVPFDEWVPKLFAEPETPMNSVFWRRHRHDRLVAQWAEVVGPDRVTVVAVDDADPGMVLRVFEGLTGLRDGTLEHVADLSNRSMTVPEIEAIRAFNRLYKAESLPVSLYSRVIRFGAAPYMRRRVPDPTEPRIQLPAASLDDIARVSREMVDAIAASGVRVIGDLEQLATPPRAATASPGPVAINPEVVATASLGILLASGLARGTGSILTDEQEGQAADDALRPAPRPVQEPAELLRISTLQLAIVILRRGRAAVLDRLGVDRIRRLLRRRRSGSRG